MSKPNLKGKNEVKGDTRRSILDFLEWFESLRGQRGLKGEYFCLLSLSFDFLLSMLQKCTLGNGKNTGIFFFGGGG